MKKGGKAYYMISAVAQNFYNIHPQTLVWRKIAEPSY